VQGRIDEVRKMPEYARGDRATVDYVQQLFQLKTPGQVLEPELSSRPAELTTPPGFDLPPIVVEDAKATLTEMGLGGQGQGLFAFGLGAAGPPTLPHDYRPPTPEVALGKLRESEGQFADHVLDTAHDAVSVLEHLRSRAGRPAGELRQFLDRTGAGNDPRVIKFFARLAGRFNSTEPNLMKDAARRRSAR